jgi:hypothetical protein
MSDFDNDELGRLSSDLEMLSSMSPQELSMLLQDAQMGQLPPEFPPAWAIAAALNDAQVPPPAQPPQGTVIDNLLSMGSPQQGMMPPEMQQVSPQGMPPDIPQEILPGAPPEMPMGPPQGMPPAPPQPPGGMEFLQQMRSAPPGYANGGLARNVHSYRPPKNPGLLIDPITGENLDPIEAAKAYGISLKELDELLGRRSVQDAALGMNNGGLVPHYNAGGYGIGHATGDFGTEQRRIANALGITIEELSQMSEAEINARLSGRSQPNFSVPGVDWETTRENVQEWKDLAGSAGGAYDALASGDIQLPEQMSRMEQPDRLDRALSLARDSRPDLPNFSGVGGHSLGGVSGIGEIPSFEGKRLTPGIDTETNQANLQKWRDVGEGALEFLSDISSPGDIAGHSLSGTSGLGFERSPEPEGKSIEGALRAADNFDWGNVGQTLGGIPGRFADQASRVVENFPGLDSLFDMVGQRSSIPGGVGPSAAGPSAAGSRVAGSRAKDEVSNEPSLNDLAGFVEALNENNGRPFVGPGRSTGTERETTENFLEGLDPSLMDTPSYDEIVSGLPNVNQIDKSASQLAKLAASFANPNRSFAQQVGMGAAEAMDAGQKIDEANNLNTIRERMQLLDAREEARRSEGDDWQRGIQYASLAIREKEDEERRGDLWNKWAATNNLELDQSEFEGMTELAGFVQESLRGDVRYMDEKDPNKKQQMFNETLKMYAQSTGIAVPIARARARISKAMERAGYGQGRNLGRMPGAGR